MLCIVFGCWRKHSRARWVNVPLPAILSGVLTLDVGNPADYWTVPNLGLGFLPWPRSAKVRAWRA